MKNLKSLQHVIKARRDFSQSEIDEIISDVYDAEGNVLCVDAQHIEDGSDGYSYTWYIPCNIPQDEIQLGDILDVEISIFPYHAKVKVTREPYQKTMLMHRKDIHPYCKVNRVIERENESVFRSSLHNHPLCAKLLELKIVDNNIFIKNKNTDNPDHIRPKHIIASIATDATMDEIKTIIGGWDYYVHQSFSKWQECNSELNKIEKMLAECQNLSQGRENRAYVEAWNNQD